MTDDELVTLIRQEIEQAEGYDSDELAENRERALNYYYGRKRGDEVVGRSQVQSLDVADMLEAVLAQIMPALEIDNVAMFEPENASDVDQANAESDAVNDVIMEANRGYVLFQETLRDALLLRNGWVKVWVDEVEETITHSYEQIPVLAANELVQTQDPNVTVDVVEQETTGELTDITLRITKVDRQLRVSAIDPTMMLFSENHDSIFLDDIRFIAERDFPTRTDLRNEGHPKKLVDGLKAITLDTKNDSQARNRNSDTSKEAHEPSMDMLERYTCSVLVDYDGDGIAERRQVQIVERTLLVNEPDEYIPYATGTPFLQPHRLNGLSLFDKLRQVQDIKTATLRNYLDNMSANNYQRLAYRDGAVDPDHMVNARPGGLIACLDPQTDLREMPILDTGSSNIQLLEYVDKMRSERGGASLDLQAAELQIAGETAHGIERQFSSREQLAAMMSRTLAETLVRSVYLKVHQAMRLFMRGQISFRRGGEDVQVQPEQWPARERLNIKTGLSQGERGRMIQALGAVVAEHKELAGAGMTGIMFTPAQTFSAYEDMTRAAGLDNPERYWTNPESDDARAAAAQAQQQAEQERQRAEQQQQAILQTQLAIEQISAAVKAQGDRLDAFVDLLKIQAEGERAEAELVAGAVTELEKAALGGSNGAGETEGSSSAVN